MKIKNYTIFNHNNTKNWNKLRDSIEFTSYFVPRLKKDYISKLNDFKINLDIENDFTNLIKKHSINKLVSLCSGSCQVEFYLMNKFNLKCHVSDTTESMQRVKKFNIFDSVSIIDVRKPFKLNIDNNTIVLLSRIDTEFDDDQLKNIFRNLNLLEVKIIYFVPAEILNAKSFLVNIKIIIKCFLYFRKPVSWGMIRSYSSFEGLWKKYYKTNSKNIFGLTLLKND